MQAAFRSRFPRFDADEPITAFVKIAFYRALILCCFIAIDGVVINGLIVVANVLKASCIKIAIIKCYISWINIKRGGSIFVLS